MFGALVLGLLILSLLLAGWKLFELYQTHFEVGSAPWNAHQIALREELARTSLSHEASGEARDSKEQRYTRRLELQLAHNLFADEVERRRAERHAQWQRFEAAQALERLRRDDAA